MMKTIISFLFIFFFMVSPVFAAPAVSSVAGTVSGGETVVVTGTNFGSTGPTIYKWDDFEGGTHTVGQNIGNGPGSTAWTSHVVAGNSPKIASGGKTNSSKYVQQKYSISSTGGFVFEYPSTPSPVYVSYWFNWAGTITGTNVKLISIVNPANCSSWYYAGPIVATTWPATGSDYAWIAYDDNESCTHIGWAQNYTSIRPTQGHWIRGEFYGVESDANTENGTAIWSVQRELNGLWTTILNYNGNANTHLDADEHWVASVFGRYASGSTLVSNWDDIYMANSRARVEIGNESTWNNCTHREIQIPSAWAADEITITVNQGSFASLANQYLFVLDSDGTMSAGYQISGSCGNAVCDAGECIAGCTDDCAVVDCCGIEGCNVAIGETVGNCPGDCSEDPPPVESGAPGLSSVGYAGVGIN